MARRATLRASDADREQVVDRLRRAAAEGRLAVHELEQRVATALGARTYGELDETVSDLPGGRAEGGRTPAPRRAASLVRAHPALLLLAVPVVLTAVAIAVAITVMWAALVLVALLLGHHRRIPRGPWAYGGRGYGGRGYGPGRGYGGRAYGAGRGYGRGPSS